MGFRKELLALVFGLLLILVTFGDNHLGSVLGIPVGNLDTVFGRSFWRTLDALYPLATIGVFLLFGWSKGAKWRLRSAPMFLFISFIVVLALMNADDVLIGLSYLGLSLGIYLPVGYWVVISWIFPIYSTFAFFLFGKLLKNSMKTPET